MTPRERVELALNHNEPDRIPIDLGGTIVSSIAKSSYITLKQYLGQPVGEITILAVLRPWSSVFRLLE